MSRVAKGMGTPLPAPTLEDAWQQSAELDEYNREIREAEARLGFQVEYSQSLLKSLLWVNGGAIVALFSLIGLGEKAGFQIEKIFYSFAFFSAGVAAILFAYICAFFSQLFFMESSLRAAWNHRAKSAMQKPNDDPLPALKKGNWSMLAGVVTATLSLVFFLIGAAYALRAVL